MLSPTVEVICFDVFTNDTVYDGPNRTGYQLKARRSVGEVYVQFTASHAACPLRKAEYAWRFPWVG
eukprot:scaffold14028_cov123-Skeletonema_dohrnii-CCMP3373.AAC.3